MSQKSSTLFVFVFLVVISVLLFFLSSIPFLQPIERLITVITSPIQQSFYHTIQKSNEESSEIRRLTEENHMLQKKLVDQKKLQNENSALKDQFLLDKPDTILLLPATVIGAPGFIPGISSPEKLILNKGRSDGVTKGHAVIVKNTIIGVISSLSDTLSVVSVIGKSDIAFTAKTLETNAVGVVQSNKENGIELKNVVLSQKLKRGDVVITKGDIDASGKGIPPDMIVGKIVAMDKKASALFQTAQVKSLIELSNNTTVFIVQTIK